MDFSSLTQRIVEAQRSQCDYNYRFRCYSYRYTFGASLEDHFVFNHISYCIFAFILEKKISATRFRIRNIFWLFYIYIIYIYTYYFFILSLFQSFCTHLASRSETLRRCGCGWACPWSRIAIRRAFCFPATCLRGPRRRRRGPAGSLPRKATGWRDDPSPRWGPESGEQFKGVTDVYVARSARSIHRTNASSLHTHTHIRT